MNSPDYYRAEAVQLRELAAKSRDPEAVRRWLQMALEYERLAAKRAQERPDAEPLPQPQPAQRQQAQGQQARVEPDEEG